MVGESANDAVYPKGTSFGARKLTTLEKLFLFNLPNDGWFNGRQGTSRVTGFTPVSDQ